MTQTDELPLDVSASTESSGLSLPVVAIGALVLGAWGVVAGPALTTAGLLLPAILPIALWVAWNDMAFMKIPNAAVLSLMLVFAVLGAFAYPFEVYLWRWTHFAVLLVAGFVLNMGRVMGAGDAKFLAAMGPFLALEDIAGLVRIFAAVLLAAFAAHRIARATPALRNLVPHWESWQRRDFPMGLALGGFLAAYMALLVYYGR